MAESDIPERVRHFIFEKIDSAEQLEILLFLRQRSEDAWSVQNITAEIRSTPLSVASRLESLEVMGLIQKEGEQYRYSPPDEETKETIDLLNDIYKIRRPRVFELIFSPMKKVKHFAEAFMMGKPPKKGDQG